MTIPSQSIPAGLRPPDLPEDKPVVAAARGGTIVRRRPSPADAEPARYRKRSHRLEVGLAILWPLLLLLAWELAARAGWIDTRFFPAPTHIWTAGVDLVSSGELQDALLISLRRVAWGFFLGSFAGIALGVVLAQSRVMRNSLQPLIYALWTVPKVALLPLFLLIFGIGETPIVILIAITCFFLVFIPTLAAMISVPFAYREAAQSFEANRWQVLRHVTIPASLPQIFVALRLTAGASILTLVAVEFVQSRAGIGFLIWNSWSLFLADRMYVGIVVIAVVGAVFTLLVALVGRKLSPWAREG